MKEDQKPHYSSVAINLRVENGATVKHTAIKLWAHITWTARRVQKAAR